MYIEGESLKNFPNLRLKNIPLAEARMGEISFKVSHASSIHTQRDSNADDSDIPS